MHTVHLNRNGSFVSKKIFCILFVLCFCHTSYLFSDQKFKDEEAKKEEEKEKEKKEKEEKEKKEEKKPEPNFEILSNPARVMKNQVSIDY